MEMASLLININNCFTDFKDNFKFTSNKKIKNDKKEKENEIEKNVFESLNIPQNDNSITVKRMVHITEISEESKFERGILEEEINEKIEHKRIKYDKEMALNMF